MKFTHPAGGDGIETRWPRCGIRSSSSPTPPVGMGLRRAGIECEAQCRVFTHPAGGDGIETTERGHSFITGHVHPPRRWGWD